MCNDEAPCITQFSKEDQKKIKWINQACQVFTDAADLIEKMGYIHCHNGYEHYEGTEGKMIPDAFTFDAAMQMAKKKGNSVTRDIVHLMISKYLGTDDYIEGIYAKSRWFHTTRTMQEVIAFLRGCSEVDFAISYQRYLEYNYRFRIERGTQ